MKVYLNGSIIDETDAKISVFDHGFLYGDGIFESLKYEDGEVLNINKHIKRLQHSAKVMMLKVPDVDFEKVILDLIHQNQLIKSRVRITLSRGSNNYNFTHCQSPTLLITAIPFQEKRKDFYKGSKTCSLKMERPVPHIKTTQILPSILAQQKMHKFQCDECFFVNHKGEITEGSTSNIFFEKDGIIYTPPLDVCLEGTMRSKILEQCKKQGITVIEKVILYKDIQNFDSAFWTNALYGFVLIKEIDEVIFNVDNQKNKLLSFQS